MPPVITVHNLSKQFKDVTAVNGLSFTVNEGDVYGFLGQNGAGKSTSIRMLLTLVQPTGGEIMIFGKNLRSHRSEILSQVGAVIEKPDLYKYLSAYQNLSIFAKMSNVKLGRDKLMQQLEMVGLADRAHSKVKTFSQGMKQRLGIAVALVHDPKLIILDEPTNGLDPQGIAEMRNLILSLSKDHGKTVVVSSHLLSEIELIANRMVIIHKGKKMAEGEVSALMDPSQTIVIVKTLADIAARQKLMQTRWASCIEANDEQLRLKMDQKEIPALTADMVNMNIELVAVQPRHSLEDYFLSLTTQPRHVEAFTN